MQRILTGLRANNDLHIGNLLGALLPLVKMAKDYSEEYEVFLMMADLHSFNIPIKHDELYKQIQDNLLTYAAVGLPLNNPRVRIFRQSTVPAHSELAYILSCFTGFGELSRMTQFKDKSQKIGNDRVSAGLFFYPPLMAADVLLYNAEYVPVGDDQSQHLEYIRDVAKRLNNKFEDELLTVPYEVSKQHSFFGSNEGLRVMDLVDPTKKMSKSDDTGKGVVFLNDTVEDAKKKIMSATTDSVGEINFDKVNQPGITNLLVLLALLEGRNQEEVNQEFVGQTQYGDLKKRVADAVEKTLTELQEAYNNVDEAKLKEKLEESEEQMREIANQTLLKVQKAVGLRQ